MYCFMVQTTFDGSEFPFHTLIPKFDRNLAKQIHKRPNACELIRRRSTTDRLFAKKNEHIDDYSSISGGDRSPLVSLRYRSAHMEVRSSVCDPDRSRTGSIRTFASPIIVDCGLIKAFEYERCLSRTN